METVSLLGGQDPLVIVQINTFVPTFNPVTAEVSEVGVVIVPEPVNKVHIPVPTTGVFPAKTEDPTLHKF